MPRGKSNRKPNDKYVVIYADPPWQYDDKCTAGKRGVDYKYRTMSEDHIIALGQNNMIQNVAAEDALLFLWITGPHIGRGLRVMGVWGFKYKTLAFVWVKKNKIKDSLAWGMGNWTRSNAELVLMGVRGKPKRADAGVHQVVIAPRQGHSSKPLEVRDRITKLVGDVPRLELFARSRGKGWDATGLEYDGLDVGEFLRGRI